MKGSTIRLCFQAEEIQVGVASCSYGLASLSSIGWRVVADVCDVIIRMDIARIADWCQDMVYFAGKAGRLGSGQNSQLSSALQRIAAFCQAECSQLLALMAVGESDQVTVTEESDGDFSFSPALLPPSGSEPGVRASTARDVRSIRTNFSVMRNGFIRTSYIDIITLDFDSNSNLPVFICWKA